MAGLQAQPFSLGCQGFRVWERGEAANHIKPYMHTYILTHTCSPGYFLRCPVLPILNFVFFGASLLMMSVFHSTRSVGQLWADPFSGVCSTFGAQGPKSRFFLLHPTFWPFLDRPLDDVRFHPTMNFRHFWASSPVTPLTFPNVSHLNPETLTLKPKH